MKLLWFNIKNKEHRKIIEKFINTDYKNNKITDLAKNLGLEVIYVDERKSFNSFLDMKGEKPTIYVNNMQSKIRKRFTIAHKIAHFVLGHSSSARDSSKKYERIIEEYIANILAEEILMPIKIIIEIIAKNEGKSIDELVSIMKEHFQVSKTAMLVRLNMCFGINSEIV